MNQIELSELIKRNSSLFWYIPDENKDQISLDALVEAILNYGDTEAVKQLFEVAGIDTVAAIFFRNSQKQRVNYFPQVLNYFTLYFNRHAPGGSNSASD